MFEAMGLLQFGDPFSFWNCWIDSGRAGWTSWRRNIFRKTFTTIAERPWTSRQIINTGVVVQFVLRCHFALRDDQERHTEIGQLLTVLRGDTGAVIR